MTTYQISWALTSLIAPAFLFAASLACAVTFGVVAGVRAKEGGATAALVWFVLGAIVGPFVYLALITAAAFLLGGARS